MTKRNESFGEILVGFLFNKLCKLPWWVNVGLSLFVYLFCKYVMKSMKYENQFVDMINKNWYDNWAWLLALPFLIIALISFLLNKKNDDKK